MKTQTSMKGKIGHVSATSSNHSGIVNDKYEFKLEL